MLITEQATRLDAAMSALRELPTPELIHESARIRFAELLGEESRDAFRVAVAGSIAAQKILVYLPGLRRFNEERVEIGTKIRELTEQVGVLSLTDPETAAERFIESVYLGGEQEFRFHGFAMCVRTVFKMLPIAAKAADYDIPAVDLERLKSFEPLRHFYEHLDDRLPGGKYDHIAVQEIDEGDGWRIFFGLPTDEDGRIWLSGTAIEVSSDSMFAVQGIAERAWNGIRDRALETAEVFLRSNPDAIPDPRKMGRELKVSLGGVLAGKNPLWRKITEGWTQVGDLWLPGGQEGYARTE